ncbi:MAG: hypothetical protein ABI459_07450 [Deltaproteobacteria bacterium]
MQFEGVSAFVRDGKSLLAAGPIAVIFDEDSIALDETVAHAVEIGFRQVIVVSPFAPEFSSEPKVHLIAHDFRAEGFQVTLNAIIAVTPPKVWVLSCFNAEFLWYPFLESRSVGELCAFHGEERRSAFFTMVVDAYGAVDADDPGHLKRDETWFDGAGYYALARHDPVHPLVTLERQIDLYGGLRWRLEQLLPWDRRRIDRISLFQAQPGLEMRADHTLNDAEMNTVSCPWHHNLTVAVVSFRAAKALKANATTRDLVGDLRYDGSVRFDWTSGQLMQLGMIDPGQWF